MTYTETMSGLLDVSQSPFTSQLYSIDPNIAREARNYLIWQIATGVWVEYLRKPGAMKQELWSALTPRFTVTNVQTPVLVTILSAAYGGAVTRRVNSAYNPEELRKIVASPWYADFVKRCVTKGIMYGTGYAVPGFRNGKANGVELSPLTARISTNEDDVEDLIEVKVTTAKKERMYRSDGIYERGRWIRFERKLPDSNYGFIPVCRFFGRRMDTSSPYGESLLWPAAQETVQITFLSNDLMVLERMQSFSTLVIQGNEVTNPESKGHSPFVAIRLNASGDESNAKAYYISPQAAIDKVDDLIESKFERTATQCQVPVEIFTRARSGTNQGTGAALLTHKPLYDLVIELQNQGRHEELELLAMYDAMITWQKSGGVPQDLDRFREKLDVDVVFERESNPAITQSEAQTYQMLVDEGFVSFRKAYLRFNPDAEESEVAEAERRWNERRTLMSNGAGAWGAGGADASEASEDDGTGSHVRDVVSRGVAPR